MGIPSLTKYRVVWRRVGAWDTFEHRLEAPDSAEAQAESTRQVQEALGSNVELWRIVEVGEAGASRMTVLLGYPTVL